MRPHVGRQARSIIIFAIAISAAPASHGAEELADYLERSWYETEVIIFQRSHVTEATSAERLISLTAPPFSSRIRAFVAPPDQIGAGYVLDAQTLAALEFPAVAEVVELVGYEPPPDAAQATTEAAAAAPAITPVLEPDPLLEFMDLIARYEEQLQNRSYRWLPASSFLMARDARLLQRRGSYQVLLHGRWLQPVPDRDRPEPLFIQAGTRLDAQFQLEGTLAVTLGRYLHFRANLNYREPGMGQSPIGLPVSLTEPGGNTPLPPPARGHMLLNESRRMRSEEIHYLDHPKLGVIVRIDPVAFPDDLVAEFQTLQETLQ